MTAQTFNEYLVFLRNQYKDNKPIHLILDHASAHMTQESIQKASQLNIKMYYIPSGFTDILQPLDLAVFAPLKEMIAKYIRSILLKRFSEKIGMEAVVKIFNKNRDNVPKHIIERGWNKYIY